MASRSKSRELFATSSRWTADGLRNLTFFEPSDSSRSGAHGYARVRRYFNPVEHIVQAKEEELHEAESKEADIHQRLDELEAIWGKRRDILVEQIRQQRKQRITVARRLDYLRPSYHFTEGKVFILFSGALTLLNMVCLGMVLRRTDNDEGGFTAFQTMFNVWYTAEMLLKLAGKGEAILTSGPLGYRMAAWLDAGLCANGLMSTTLPLRPVCRELIIVLVLRLVLFSRFALVQHWVYASADMSFMEGRLFKGIMVVAVIGNSIVLGLETDCPWRGWYFADQVFLAVFVAELVLNIKAHGFLRFIQDPNDWYWHCLDVVVVVSGVIDQWLIPTVAIFMAVERDKRMMLTMQLVRLLRLIRLGRIMRLARRVRPLDNLMQGIVEAIHSMGWVIVLTALFLYASALIVVRFLGHGLLFSGPPPAHAAKIFKTVPDSMFVLFQVMNGRQKEFEPLFQELPWTKVAFVGFMVSSNWAILAVLTAVVSETMLKATEANEARQNSDEAQQARIERLCDVFQQHLGDDDDSGILTQAEFTAMLQDEYTCLELCECTSLTKRDLEELFGILAESDDTQTCIHYEDFIDKILMQDTLARERSVLRLQKGVRRLEKRVRADLREMRRCLMDGRHLRTSTVPSARTAARQQREIAMGRVVV